MKLIADDESPFPKQFQDNNATLLEYHFNRIKQGTVKLESVQFITSALNYLSGFIKAKLIDVDIADDHYKAAEAIVSMVSRKPYQLTPEEAHAVHIGIEHWKDVVSQASAKLVREIQHQVDTKSDHAKNMKARNKVKSFKSKTKRK
ncbi:hypothetical protein [Flavobacterium sp.]|jgi:hypothetical protein|uniref:hypothetical protein n=1 Tax=Flavobacterium sp. TaxID=239 RepID=UPI0037C14145